MAHFLLDNLKTSPGTSMISIVKGKTEISRNLQKVLSPFFPLPLVRAEE